MTSALAHRGPDGHGFFAEGPIALGHRRLSIIDLAGGAQPQFNEDRTVCVVFNGEIYNYLELAAVLRRHHSFRTVSDTEVLLHLYEDEGERMLGRLRGMFAFAIWDSRRARLFAARDQFGKKPFYYRYDGNELHFASELRALRRGLRTPLTIEKAAIETYLQLLYIPAPLSIYAGVQKLPAGHFLIADASGVRTQRYWSPPHPGSQPLATLESNDLRQLLADAVRIRLRSDVPVAALLSGGIDSSLVVALMAQAQGPGVKTFSVGFGQPDDELPYARLIANRYQTQHREIVIRSDVQAQTADAFAAFGEPFGDSSAVPTVAVFKEVSKEAKVVLTGDGGDELFAGYARYRDVQYLPHFRLALRVSDIIDRLPLSRLQSVLRRASAAIGSSGADRYHRLIEVFSPAERRRLLRSSSYQASSQIPHLQTAADEAMYSDLISYLPDDLMMKTDIASMHWGVEARCPLMDTVLASRVIPLASRLKQNRHDGKLLLKQHLRNLLPDNILGRKKRGFGSPVSSWLRHPLREMFNDLLRAPNATICDVVDRQSVIRIVDAVLRGRGNPHQGWALLALEAWAAHQD